MDKKQEEIEKTFTQILYRTFVRKVRVCSMKFYILVLELYAFEHDRLGRDPVFLRKHRD